MLGMCPTLAVTTSAINGIGMGLTTTVILAIQPDDLSSAKIYSGRRTYACIHRCRSILCNNRTDAFARIYSSLYSALGIYIPLIVVNCIILGRAEAYASKNPTDPVSFDGIGMGLGFTFKYHLYRCST